ncbi:MAG TPA: phosphomevalonate kinase, partial [Myxococcaceae bacterium]|nr:phosphomevalonate kinase [Myxococcaceae bacterium]
MDRCVSAPGKLFLSGEYAVLWGGTALIAAVGPRLAGCVRARKDSRIHLISATERLNGQATPLGVHWTETVPAALLFAARGIDEALRARGVPGLGFDLVIAPASRAASGGKLGLGGSAQAALISVELSRFALEGTFDPLKVTLLAHSKAQADSGSGADVAAIYAGGVVRYRRYPVDSLASASTVGQLPSALANAPPVDLRRLAAPKVRLSFAYSGKSAATLAQIQSVEARLSAAERERVTEESDQLGRAVEEALVGGDFPSLARATESL